MKKYKVIFIVLIIGIISVTGFVVYKNYVKPWKDAETYIDKYMVKQDISKDNIKSITKEKPRRQVTKEYYTKCIIKMTLDMSINIFIVIIIMLYM